MNVRHPIYIHFLSKIFFMIKWTKGFFILMWRMKMKPRYLASYACVDASITFAISSLLSLKR